MEWRIIGIHSLATKRDHNSRWIVIISVIAEKQQLKAGSRTMSIFSKEQSDAVTSTTDWLTKASALYVAATSIGRSSSAHQHQIAIISGLLCTTYLVTTEKDTNSTHSERERGRERPRLGIPECQPILLYRRLLSSNQVGIVGFLEHQVNDIY